MRGEKNWRSKRITRHFAEVKAIVYLTLLKMECPVERTKDMLPVITFHFGNLTTYCSYALVLESLHELKEQGLVEGFTVGDGGWIWWSKERLK